jgi:hypothetical protein
VIPNSVDPGPGISGLTDVNGTTSLVPLIPSPAPDATRAVPVTVSFRAADNSHFLGFMNNTSWKPLSGTTTLLAVQKDPTNYAPVGVAVGAQDQLLWTEDSIQVHDLIIVRMLLPAALVPLSYASSLKDNLDDGDHPFHLHGHRPWMYVNHSIGVFCCAVVTIADVLLHDDETEWVQGQDNTVGKS